MANLKNYYNNNDYNILLNNEINYTEEIEYFNNKIEVIFNKDYYDFITKKYNDIDVFLKIREEYALRYENLLKQLEFEEYCETASNSHKDIE